MTNLREHFHEIIGAAVSGTGAITAVASWQLQVAWTVTVMAGLVGIVSGLLTIRSLIRKEMGLRK